MLPKAHDPSPPLPGTRGSILHRARPLTAASHTHTQRTFVRTDAATNCVDEERNEKRKEKEERTRSSIKQENCRPFISDTVVDPIANQAAAPDIFKGNGWVGENSIVHRHLPIVLWAPQIRPTLVVSVVVPVFPVGWVALVVDESRIQEARLVRQLISVYLQ